MLISGVVMRREMADCMTFWTTSYHASGFCRPCNLCFDESAFTDDEGKEVTSLLDDLAEAQRHSSADNDDDADDDHISLWDDVYEEQWTTKDSNSGPTLAELNGGELTDLQQYEPLQIGRKRKRSRSSAADRPTSCQSARNLTVPVQVCDISNQRTQNVQQNSSVTDRALSVVTEHPCDKERSVLLGEQRGMKRTSSPSKPNCKVCQKFVQDPELKSQQERDNSQKVCGTSSCQLDPSSVKLSDTSESAYEFHAKKIKAHHGGPYLVYTFRG